jgi:hypothetical protein
MKTLTMAVAMAAVAAFAGEAQAQSCHTYNERHCDSCIKLFETFKLEKREVVTVQDVQVGCEDVVVGFQDEIVGYQNVWVDRTVTEYETRRVAKRVLVGRDG